MAQASNERVACDSEIALREVPLAAGGVLRVRPVTYADRDELHALCERLSDDDRHLRYFSFYRPPASAIDRLVHIEDRGGCSLVAEVMTETDAREIVAEADYELLETGDGELGITVDRRWRGWLGPYLLDALLAVAASRGVERVMADVLFENTPMLVMARSRGAKTVGHPELGVIRLAIPTPGAGSGDDDRDPREDRMDRGESTVRDRSPTAPELPALGPTAVSPYREPEAAREAGDGRD